VNKFFVKIKQTRVSSCCFYSLCCVLSYCCCAKIYQWERTNEWWCSLFMSEAMKN